MSSSTDDPRPLTVLSMVEAVTVTGPLKPLLGFSALVRSGFSGQPPVSHTLLSTRRPTILSSLDGDQLRSAAQEAGLPLITVPERHPFDFAVLPRIRRAIGEICPDLVETHDCKSHFLFYLLRIFHPRIRRCKWLAFHHGYTRTSWRVALYQQLDRLSLRHADHVVTLCKPFAQTLSGLGVPSGHITILSNFAAPRSPPVPHDLTRVRQELDIAPDECVIICVGRLSSEKGHADLISAFRAIADQDGLPSVRLLLVGDGPERSRIERLVATLEPRVVLAGHVTDPWPLLNAADIFVLPSRSEGSPLVIFEAMSAGLPIVATSVGGVPETLTNGEDALLVAPSQPAALASALSRLVRDELLRNQLGMAARATLERYSPSSYALRLLGVYGKVFAWRTAHAHPSVTASP